ncbi:MAG: winged helix-turn-helix transcriptional regulator [Akkermansiaceae bacterium]
MDNEATSSARKWTFLTNHLHIILCLHRDDTSTIRSLAVNIGITERSVQRILKELIEEEVITSQRDGRNNTYQINYHYKLRHELEKNHNIGELLEILKE